MRFPRAVEMSRYGFKGASKSRRIQRTTIFSAISAAYGRLPTQRLDLCSAFRIELSSFPTQPTARIQLRARRQTRLDLTQGTRTRTTAAPAWVKKDTGGKAATAVRFPSCVMSLTGQLLAPAFVLGAVIDGAVDAERQRWELRLGGPAPTCVPLYSILLSYLFIVYLEQLHNPP